MTEQPFRILVLADARSFHTERYVAELQRQGCTVLVASLESGTIPHEALRRRGGISSFAYALAAREVNRLMGKFLPDCISAHYASGYGFLVSRLKRGTVPATLHVWGSDVLVVPQRSWLHKRKVVRGLTAADHIFADSECLAQATRELAPGKSISVIPWGIEQRHLCFHRADYKGARPLRIIVPRMHEPVYNNQFILETLQEEIRQEKVVVTFPGFGSQYGRFRYAARALVGDRVRFYTKLKREEFLPFLASHDVYLSAAQSDSSPVSLIEAMALGLLPVAADIPGVREWLTGESGFRYPEGDGEALRQIIWTVLDTPDSFAALRMRNRERVERDAIFETNIAGQLAIMRDLAQRRIR